jgi:purine/pyrimidine-nucleoside phosphorylase
MMKHNEYFDGKVQSLGLEMAEGRATVGVMEAGTYRFSTGAEETMTIVAGVLRVTFPDGTRGKFADGDRFVVPPKSSFEVTVDGYVAYLCRYAE